MDFSEFDTHRFKERTSCSSGARHLFVLPDGSVSRCAAYWYDWPRRVLGNIGDNRLMDEIVSQRHIYKPCSYANCFGQCDGCYSEQQFEDKGISFKHRGLKIGEKNLCGRDYCILQLHLTFRCNLHCPYCCAEQWMKGNSTNDLSHDEWMRAAMKFTSTWECGHMVLMGGEPTFSSVFVPFCNVFLSSGWSIEILTNMTQKEPIRELVSITTEENRSLLSVHVSFHPSSKGFNVDDAIRFARELHEGNGIRIAANLVDTEENRKMESQYRIMDRMKALGASFCAWQAQI